MVYLITANFVTSYNYSIFNEMQPVDEEEFQLTSFI